MQIQPFQVQFLQGQMGQNLTFQSQLYPGHTFQQLIQPQYVMTHTRYLRGMQIQTAQAIPGYLGYPPLGMGLAPQGYQYPSQDPIHQFPFIATFNFLDLSQLTNYPLIYLPYWLTIHTKFPNDIPKFEGKLGEDLFSHVMTYHI